MNKDDYWQNKPDNIGSKRVKTAVIRNSQLGRYFLRLERNLPDIRNDKKHRDARTAMRSKDQPIKQMKDLK